MISPFLSERFTEALVGAARLHATQLRKGTDIPYVSHLLGVTAIALEHGAQEDEAIAAVLHDVIEDIPEHLGADWARKWIGFRFGQAVLGIVEGCTDTDAKPKPPWLARKTAYINHIASASPSVVLVSASDKLHNARTLLADFTHVGDRLWDRFNKDAGKAGVLGYYRGLVDAFRATGYQTRLVTTLDREVSALEEAAHVRATWPPLAV